MSLGTHYIRPPHGLRAVCVFLADGGRFNPCKTFPSSICGSKRLFGTLELLFCHGFDQASHIRTAVNHGDRKSVV